MADTISLFRAFIRVVEAGSFTRVAQEQNSSQPTVSRQVAALEEHLGTRLFTRTTRKLTLTDDGRGFYERAKLAIEAVSEAEDAVGRRRSRPSGALRLAMPVVFGRLRVIPHLKEFLTRYPDVTIDLMMNKDRKDPLHHAEAMLKKMRVKGLEEDALRQPRQSGPQPGGARRRALWLVLDRRLRMG